MDIEKILRQFKTIQPDESAAASSRRTILLTERATRRPFSVARFIFSNLQSASAIALTGFLMILIFGGFSIFSILNPFRLSSLDPVGLHAEAQAVDMQIQIAGLAYDETQKTAGTTTASTTSGASSRPAAKKAALLLIGQASSTNEASSTPPVSVDDALDMLSN